MPNANTPDQRLQRAVALHQAGQVADAVLLYEKIVKKSPDAAGVLNLLGIARFQLGNLPQAATAMRRALRLNPALPNADYNLGRILQAQKQFDEALQCYEKAIGYSPDDVEILNNLGTVLAALDRHAEAIPVYRRAVALQPNAADVWFNLGNACSAEYLYAEAVAAYERTLALRPDHVPVLRPMASALIALNRYEEAIRHLRRVTDLEPGDGSVFIGLGIALAASGREAEALESFDRALALKVEAADALWNKGVVLLAYGRFAEGWALFKHRWTAKGIEGRHRPYPQPPWDGAPVSGTLLVWAEQGVGDEVLLSSMLPDLRGRAERIVVEADARLVPLFERSFAGITVVPRASELYAGPVTVQAPLGDLGQFLRPDAASFRSAADGYLAVDSQRAEDLRARLAGDGRRVVGLSWVSKNRTSSAAKSAHLVDFLPVLQMPNCRFIDLQYGDTSEERAQLAATHGIEVERVPDLDTMNDIDGLSALIAACDIVVTVSNTTAHLTGAQGKTGWVLLPYAFGRFWYWQQAGSRSPFYNSLRLCRPHKDQAWSDVIASIAPEIRQHLER